MAKQSLKKKDRIAAVTVRGGAAESVWEQARELNPHEMALAAAGLFLLLLAPFISHLVGAPDDPAAWGGLGRAAGGAGPGSAVFSDAYAAGAPSPEPRRNASGKDEPLITPLEAMDPLSMIRRSGADAFKTGELEGRSAEGDGASGGEGAGAAGGAGTSGGSGESWKDALQAAKGAISQASRSAALPRPGASAARGIGGTLNKIQGLGTGAQGATSSSASSGLAQASQLARPSSASLVGSPQVLNSLSRVQSAGDIRGVASRGSGAALLEATRQNRGGAFFDQGRGAETLAGMMSGISRPDSASGSAAAQSVQQQNMDSILKGVANPSSGQKSITSAAIPENLAQLRAKSEMEKKLALKYDKKRYEQIERKKMFEQIATQTLFQTASQAFLKVLDKVLENGGNGSGQNR